MTERKRWLAGCLSALLSLPLAAAVPGPDAPADLARGKAMAQKMCSRCHDDDGNGGPRPNRSYPKLAGLDRELRVLQEHTLERLGSNQSIPVDCRVIAATKADLAAMGKSGQFRSDLYYRLNVVSLELPALRDRREDILLLFEHFLQQSSLRFDRPAPELDRATVASLMAHDWPGNVRELRNVAERFALGLPVFNKGGQAVQTGGPRFAEAVEAFEKALLGDALARHHGNLTQASQDLGMAKTTLFDKVKKYGLQ